MEPVINCDINPDARSAWQLPVFETPFWLGKQHPWCIVIPVINEGRRIQNLLDRMSTLKIDIIADIIIVDGGSRDGSLELESLQQKGVRGLLVKTGKKTQHRRMNVTNGEVPGFWCVLSNAPCKETRSLHKIHALL